MFNPHFIMRIEAVARRLEDPGRIDLVGQRAEIERFQFVDHLFDLGLPVVNQLIPILEVETGALQKDRHARPRSAPAAQQRG